MRFVHLYTGDDGRSHVRDLELATVADAGGVCFELRDHVQGLSVRDLPPGWTNDLHVAPRRQLVLQLQGVGEIVCGDGSRRTFGPGDLLLADDTTGEGHRSRTLEDPRRQLLIFLDPDLDLDAITEPAP